LNAEKIKEFQIPLPPKEIQEKIVAEIGVLEKAEAEAKEKVTKLKFEIANMFSRDAGSNYEMLKLGDACEMKAGQFVKVGDINDKNQDGLYPCYGGNGLRGYTKTYTHEGLYSLVGRQGALCGNVHLVKNKFHATEHALVVTPKSNVDTIWLFHKLVSMNLNQFATGTAQPGLSVINLTPVQILVPPLPEQRKIVSEIKKIETQIADFEQQLSEIPKQKEAVLAKYL
jgi:restriction endonuclease S subunit